jgi:phosphotransferase system HPr-like phosphotransfer protein
MTNFEFKLPENGNLSQSLVASAISNLAIHYTDCEINVYSTNAANQVNAKSLLGLFTIVLTPGTTLHFSIIGETDSYSSQSMQRKLKTLFSA